MNKSLTTTQSKSIVAQSNNDITYYLNLVAKSPMLDKQEERELAKKYINNGDLDAAKTLVMSQLKFVIHIAKGYSGYGLALSDIISEGNIGLMKAVKRFDPTRKVRLISFAVHWIKAEIHEFIIRNWRIVKIATTKAQRKLFFKLRSNKKRLGWFNKKEVDAIASDLGVKAKTVLQMEMRMANADTQFDAPVNNDNNNDEKNNWAPQSYLKQKNADPAVNFASYDERQYNTDKMLCFLKTIDKRSYDILQQRYLNEKKTTLNVLAKKYNISNERVRQIEQNALLKIRNLMQQ
ncbi:MAG: RNA polymerase sigma factor RpoH [Gammaproteobacteria bacterium]|nr:MAG: RNA polymerase sigma factor RpoH [Gammaproteobacteria bacterium]